MIYLEADEQLFVVSNSEGSVLRRTASYDEAWKAVTREAERANSEVALLHGGRLDIRERLLLFGLHGLSQVRRIHDNRRNKYYEPFEDNDEADWLRGCDSGAWSELHNV
jgi:hypothetical protein